MKPRQRAQSSTFAIRAFAKSVEFAKLALDAGEEANPLTEIGLYGILTSRITDRRITRLEDHSLEGWLTLISSTG